MKLFYIILLIPILAVNSENVKDKKEDRAATKLPPCAACGALVKSFMKAVHKSNSNSIKEDKLSKIHQSICKDVERGENQCLDNHQQWDNYLQEWLELDEIDRPLLKDWLCVDKIKVCCPDNHYGPECEPCSLKDETGKICSGNGKCKGSGTRKGNGKCSCERAYRGELCNQCNLGFYESYKDNKKVLCSPCHKSCKGHCSGSGAKSCIACKAGFQMDTEHGCVDIDECYLSKPCAGNKFCVNTEGGYKCLKCDASCDGCDGDGPDNCEKCAEGHKEETQNGQKICVSDKTTNKIFHINNMRFFTYVGLIVATGIIFQRSYKISAVLGVVVAIYVSLSEYYIHESHGDLRPVL